MYVQRLHARSAYYTHARSSEWYGIVTATIFEGKGRGSATTPPPKKGKGVHSREGGGECESQAKGERGGYHTPPPPCLHTLHLTFEGGGGRQKRGGIYKPNVGEPSSD